jgi:ketosteroid isomerase-like protein
MDADDTTATIAALEDRRFAAMCARDWATLDELLSDDLSYTHSSARVDSKASYIQGMRDNIFV